MRLTLLFAVMLSALCALSFGCNSAPKAPAAEEIRAALENAFKKDDPSATVKLTDISMNPEKSAVYVKFSCTNCAVDADAGGKKKLPSGKGEATVWTTYPEKQWAFQHVLVKDDDGKPYTFSGMSGFKF